MFIRIIFLNICIFISQTMTCTCLICFIQHIHIWVSSLINIECIQALFLYLQQGCTETQFLCQWPSMAHCVYYGLHHISYPHNDCIREEFLFKFERLTWKGKIILPKLQSICRGANILIHIALTPNPV